MIGEKHCPFCRTPSLQGCAHLALAVEGRDFVRRCIDLCQGQAPWKQLCESRRESMRTSGEWSADCEDFTWLETAFCNAFLQHLRWFGGIVYEWRSSARSDQAGFWVLLWSKHPQR